ncbi:MAG: hypothetical protein MZU97_06525 [Bacillus subtilis]|nr:hypothetical protein [Bacillus subtilis]
MIKKMLLIIALLLSASMFRFRRPQRRISSIRSIRSPSSPPIRPTT